MAAAPKPPRTHDAPSIAADARAEALVADHEKLRTRLGDLEKVHRDLQQRLTEVEEHNQALERLFVTTYRLHASLDPAEVLTTLDEILLNLLGVERFGLWEIADDGELGELLLGSQGGEGAGTLTSQERALALATLTLGAWFLQRDAKPKRGVQAVAAVPMKVGSDVLGVLLIRKFLDHKAVLTNTDRRVLGLLGEQAGTALLSARLHAARRHPS